MKHVLTSGDCTNDFKRLGINPRETYKGNDYSVYEFTQEEFNILMNEEDDIYGAWEECGWRYAEGCTLEKVYDTFTVKGKEMLGFINCSRREEIEEEVGDELPKEYAELQDYLCLELGVSTFRNVAAVAIDLANINDITMGELFTRYQG